MWEYGDLFKLTPREFEQLLADLWKAMGYKVTITGGSGDKGVDLIAVMERGVKLKVYIQAKRYAPDNKVSANEIREYASLFLKREADCVVVICTSGFTAQALAEAKELNIRTIDGYELVKLLNANNIPSPYAKERPVLKTAEVKVQPIPPVQSRVPSVIWNSLIRSSHAQIEHLKRALKFAGLQGSPVGLLLGKFKDRAGLKKCILYFTDKELIVLEEAPPSNLVAAIDLSCGANVNLRQLYGQFVEYVDIEVVNPDKALSLTLYKIPFNELAQILSKLPSVESALPAMKAIWDSLIRSSWVKIANLHTVLGLVQPRGNPIGLLRGKVMKAQGKLQSCILFFTDQKLLVLENTLSAELIASIDLTQGASINARHLHGEYADIEVKTQGTETPLQLYKIPFNELAQILSKIPNVQSELPAMKASWDALIRSTWVDLNDLLTIWPHAQNDKPIGLLLGKWASPPKDCLLFITNNKIYVISRDASKQTLAIGNAKELWRIARAGKRYVDIAIKDVRSANNVNVRKVDAIRLSMIATSLESLRCETINDEGLEDPHLQNS